jgi:hypothetical protein
VFCLFGLLYTTCPPLVSTRFELLLGVVARKGLTPFGSLAWWRQGSE